MKSISIGSQVTYPLNLGGGLAFIFSKKCDAPNSFRVPSELSIKLDNTPVESIWIIGPYA